MTDIPLSPVQNILISATAGTASPIQTRLAFSLGSAIPLHVDPKAGDQYQAEIKISPFFRQHSFVLNPELDERIKEEETQLIDLTPVDTALEAITRLLPAGVPIIRSWSAAEHVSGAERGASEERSVQNIVGARSGFLSKGWSDRSVSLRFRSDTAHTTSLGHAQIHPEFTCAFNN